MISNVKEDIQQAIYISKQYAVPFGIYCNIYPWTNERISPIFEQLTFDKTNILTVCGGGEHVLEAILNGSKNVTTFDINRLALYYLDLKLAALLSYDRKDFLRLMPTLYEKDDISQALEMLSLFCTHNFYEDQYRFAMSDVLKIEKQKSEELLSSDRLLENLKNLSSDSHQFWTSLYQEDPYIMASFLFKNFDIPPKEDLIKNIKYLHDDESYEKLKSTIPTANIKKEAIPMQKLASVHRKEKFGLIHLSNISNNNKSGFGVFLIGTTMYASFVKKKIYPLLEKNGIVIVNTIQPFEDKFEEGFEKVGLPISYLDLGHKKRVYYKQKRR